MMKRVFRQGWLRAALALALVAALLVAVLKKLLPFPQNIVAVHKQPGEKLVVLFGDSITQGVQSYNYVELLTHRLQGAGYRFLNAGIGGDTAYNLLQRIEPVVQSRPYKVVIMVGTNDVQTYLRGGHMAPMLQRMKKLPQAMTLEWYLSMVRKLVQTLQRETAAQVTLCSIPILGEDLDSRPNEAVRMFNAALKPLAGELNVAYLRSMKHWSKR